MKRLLGLTIFMAVMVVPGASAFASELVVYTARKEHLIRPLFDAYTKDTGIKIQYVTGKAPVLLQRLKAEGENTPADLLITVDAGNLWHAAREEVLQPVASETLKRNIPAHLRDPGMRWFGLSVRARTLVYSIDRVKPAELSTYEDLAHPKWKDRLVLRTSKKVYNQSLVAMLISAHGSEKTEKIVRGWVRNLVISPFSNDTNVMRAIVAGQGDVGIVNTYYYGRLLRKNPDLPLSIFWPNQKAGGVHVNVSGAGLVAHSRLAESALHLLEWLSTEAAQQLFADANLEYPANPRVSPHPTVAAWGTFAHNPINLENAGALQANAIRLMDRAGYK